MSFDPPTGNTSPSYDNDGNLTGDGTWTYSYDAENRLSEMSKSGLVLYFTYDYLGRRCEKEVVTSGTPTLDHKYIYDGWNMIAEVDALSSNQIVRSYTWGLDRSGTMTGAGGTGGLVEVTNFTYSGGSISSTTDYFASHDGNGNLVALVNSSTGAVAQAYEYSPFGEVLTWTNNDSSIENNPFGFADKYTDSETGLAYYGKRLYSPTLGRFINRDPAEEAGGINLYGFCGNDSVDGLDVLGNYPAYYGANYVPPALIHPPGLNNIGPLGTYRQYDFGDWFQPTISTQNAFSEIELEADLTDIGTREGLDLAFGVMNGSVSLQQGSAYLALNQNSGGTLTMGMIQGMLQAGAGTYTPNDAIALGAASRGLGEGIGIGGFLSPLTGQTFSGLGPYWSVGAGTPTPNSDAYYSSGDADSYAANSVYQNFLGLGATNMTPVPRSTNSTTTSSNSTNYLTTVALNFKNIPGGDALGVHNPNLFPQHSFVTITNNQTGEVWIARAGPGGPGGNWLFGSINATVVPDVPGSTLDYGATVNGSQVVLNTNENPATLVAELNQFATAVNQAQIGYNPLTQNSNSFAFQAVQLLTGSRPQSPVWAPASQTTLNVGP